MAEAPSLYAESLEKLDQELTCPICLKHFEEPKVLPCCHYYCRECIVQMQARTRGKDHFQCPECRKETRLPGNDPDSLLTAFFVNRMKELFSMMQKAQGKVELTCESCRRGTTPVEAFCRHCALFICQSCEEAHRTMRPFSDHMLVPLDDLRQNTAAHFPVNEEAQMKCKEHGGKKMKLYCYDCKQLICRDCIIKDHKEHEYEFINKAAVQFRASLKESVAPLRKIQASLSQAVVETEKTTSAVSKSGADIAAAIDRKFDELITSVQKRREELHREARERIEENQKGLTAQRKNIQQATAEVQSMIEFVDHKSQRANDQELLGLQKQIHDRVNEVTQKYRNSSEQFKPAEVCHLELVCTSQLALQTIILRCQGGKGGKDHGKSKSSIAAGTTAEEGLLQPALYPCLTTPNYSDLQSWKQWPELFWKREPNVTVEVSSLPPQTNIDELEAYFEKQGDHTEVLFTANLGTGDARVELSGLTSEEVEKLQKKQHKIKGQLVHVKVSVNNVATIPELPPQPNIFLDTLKVNGLPPNVDTELLKLYFESPRSGSHNGAVEKCFIVVPGTAHIKFQNPEVAAQVLSVPEHTICRVKVQLQYAQVPDLETSSEQYESTKHRGVSGGGNKGHGSHRRHCIKVGQKSKSSSATGAMEEDKVCSICLDEFTNPKRTKCGHKFCSGCLEKALKYDPFCPTCKQTLPPIVGKQPQGGRMTHKILYGQSLPGYRGYNTIQIDYSIPGGVQGPEHPNPGQRFSGTYRIAYLPDNYEGREVLQLLKKAFDARLIFTVGTSVTTGVQDTVVWNDIHHKTSMYGGAHGFPDPTYLQRVKDDLAAKGIVPDVHTSDSTSTFVSEYDMSFEL